MATKAELEARIKELETELGRVAVTELVFTAGVDTLDRRLTEEQERNLILRDEVVALLDDTNLKAARINALHAELNKAVQLLREYSGEVNLGPGASSFGGRVRVFINDFN